MKKLFLLITCMMLPLISLAAQSSLPNGYAGIKLGMSMDAVKEALQKDGQFGYRGERDVSDQIWLFYVIALDVLLCRKIGLRMPRGAGGMFVNSERASRALIESSIKSHLENSPRTKTLLL